MVSHVVIFSLLSTHSSFSMIHDDSPLSDNLHTFANKIRSVDANGSHVVILTLLLMFSDVILVHNLSPSLVNAHFPFADNVWSVLANGAHVVTLMLLLIFSFVINDNLGYNAVMILSSNLEPLKDEMRMLLTVAAGRSSVATTLLLCNSW